MATTSVAWRYILSQDSLTSVPPTSCGLQLWRSNACLERLVRSVCSGFRHDCLHKEPSGIKSRKDFSFAGRSFEASQRLSPFDSRLIVRVIAPLPSH